MKITKMAVVAVATVATVALNAASSQKNNRWIPKCTYAAANR